MTDTIEKVARAICWEAIVRFLERGGVMAINPDRIQEAVERDWKLHIPDARAAMRAHLEALMEPGEMALAAASRIPHARDIEIYQAMLRAKIAELDSK